MSGNVSAQIFYLKNRAPDDWRDKFENKIAIEATPSALHLEAMRKLMAMKSDIVVVEEGNLITDTTNPEGAALRD